MNDKQQIAFGSAGSAVSEAQRLLNYHGYGLEIDGQFGSKTLEATRAFQKKMGLSIDGIIGPLTWAALMKPIPVVSEPVAPTPKPNVDPAWIDMAPEKNNTILYLLGGAVLLWFLTKK